MEELNNRLQFVHHEGVFKTSEEAIDYVKQESIIDYPALYAEPMIVAYGNEKEPNIILCIGSHGNGSANLANKVFFIDFASLEESVKAAVEQASGNAEDIAQIEKAVAELQEADKTLKDAIDAESERAKKAESDLKVSVKDTDTVSLSMDSASEGSVISADVKVAKSKVVNKEELTNLLISDENGLFLNASVDYENDTLTFKANGNVIKVAELPHEVHVVSGKYDTNTESIVLSLNDGEEISIDVEDLIGELSVGKESEQIHPVILKRDSVVYNKELHSTESHQDVLSADVRLKEASDNILVKAVDNGLESLYVKGVASNIKESYKGDTQTVQEALDSLRESELKVSDKEGNIIKNDGKNGIYSIVTLAYDSNTNKLKFNNGLGEQTIQLASASLVDHVDYSNGILKLYLKLADGSTSTVEINITDIIKENRIDNTDRTVTLSSKEGDGAFTLSADVNVSDEDTNLLKVKAHALYVSNQASDIKYGKGDVAASLDTLLGGVDSEGSVKNLINAEKEAREASDVELKGSITENAHAIEANTSAFNSLKAEVEADEDAIAKNKEGIESNKETISAIVKGVEALTASVDSIKIQKQSGNDLYYDLLVDNETRGTVIIPKDNYLDSVTFDEASKVLTLNLINGGENTPFTVSLASLDNVYTQGEGVSIKDGVVSVQKSEGDEGFLEVSEQGVKVVGVKAAIEKSAQTTAAYADSIVEKAQDIAVSTAEEYAEKKDAETLKEAKAYTDTVELKKVDDLTYEFQINGVTKSTISIPKDQFLSEARYDEGNKELVFVFQLQDEKNEVRVPVGSLVDTYTVGDGLQAKGTEFSVKVAADSESYLTVSAEGVKVSGIEEAIDNAEKEAISVSKAYTESITLVQHEDNPLHYELKIGTVSLGEINIPKDQFLKSAKYDAANKNLIFVFATEDGEVTSEVNVADLVDTYGASEGLAIDADNNFSVKVAADSEAYLTVSKEGIKVSGINKAIDDIKTIVSEADEKVLASAKEYADGIKIEQSSDNDHVYNLYLGDVKKGSVEIPSDVHLENVSIADDKLVFDFVGKEQQTVDLSKYIDIYGAGDGLSLSDNTFKIELSNDSEKYLYITNGVLKLSGVDAAIKESADATIASANAYADEAAANVKVKVASTNSIALNVAEDKTLTAELNVVDATNNLIHKSEDGIYANGVKSVTYDPTTSVLTVSDGENIEEYVLSSNSLVTDAEYNEQGQLVLTVTTASGEDKKIIANFESVVGGNEANSPITVVSTKNGNVNTITATLKISTSSNNQLSQNDGALFVSKLAEDHIGTYRENEKTLQEALNQIAAEITAVDNKADKVTELSEDVKVLQSSATTIYLTATEAKSSASEAKTLATEANTNATNAKSTADELATRVTALENTSTATSESVEKAIATANAAKEASDKATESVSSYDDAIKDATDKAAEASDKADAAAEKADTATEKADAAQADVDALEETVSALTITVNELTEENAALKERVTAIEELLTKITNFGEYDEDGAEITEIDDDEEGESK